jgi:hypothetical protein
MKKDILSFKVEQPKQRNHRMLFDANLPFQPKVEKSKKGQYVRKPKHQKGNYLE